MPAKQTLQPNEHFIFAKWYQLHFKHRQPQLIIGLLITNFVTLLALAANSYVERQTWQEPASRIANGVTHQVQFSPGYEMDWNESTQIVTVRHFNALLSEFPLSERPIAAAVYQPTGTLAIVTTNNKSKSFAPQNLWLYASNQLRRVFVGRSEDVAPNLTAQSQLYSVTEAAFVPPYDSFLQFSPDGAWLLFNEQFGETNNPKAVSVANGTVLSVPSRSGQPFANDLYWSPNGQCVVDISGPGLYSGIFLTSFTPDDARSQTLWVASDQFDDYYLRAVDQTVIRWNDDCSGQIEFRNLSGDTGFYSFTQNDTILQRDEQALQEAQLNLHSPQELIFYTSYQSK